MAPAAKSTALATGRQVGPCRVQRLLGRGGMGEVYLAEHLSLQKPVALKVLPPDLVSKTSVERFLKEARMCSRIEHPNVVVIHDVGQQDGLHYIVMQYVAGLNLAQLLEREGGPLPWRSALRLIQLASRGVHAVHRAGLVHRDIKPSNIMLAQDSRVLLMDFGLVRQETESSLTRCGQIVGTPAFMPPEQCRGEGLDRRSDIYSLGSTLYCLMAGRPPFRGSLQELLVRIASGKRAKPIHQLVPTIPEEVSEIVAQAMDPSPDARFPTAEAFSKRLRRLLRDYQLNSTTSWHPTAEISGAAAETHPSKELGAVELLPLETTWESWQQKLPWLLGSAGGVVLLGVMLFSLGGQPKVDTQLSPAAPVPMGSVPAADSSAGPKIDLSRMVQIEAGFARTGSSVNKLRTHFESISLLAENESLMQSALVAGREEPISREFVPAFWIDKYEVTNEEYARFVAATGHRAPDDWDGGSPPAGQENHPVDNISPHDAEAYARWAGKQLPSLAQWQRAFRGDTDRLYPWGDSFEPMRANVAENPSYPNTSAVDATPEDVSLFGVCNLVGNVCEMLNETRTVGTVRATVLKGAAFGLRASIYGISPMQNLVTRDGTVVGCGFRCVYVAPTSAASADSPRP